MRPQARVLLAIGAVVLAGLVAWVLIPRSEKTATPPSEPTLPPVAITPATTETAATLPVDPFAMPLTPTTVPDGMSTTRPTPHAESTDPWDTALNEGRTPPLTGNAFGGHVDHSGNATHLPPDTTGTHTGPAAARTYTVQAGDSLYVISQRVLGSPKYVAAIQKANPKVDPKRLRVGQVLNIPDVAGPSTPAAVPATSHTPADNAHAAPSGLGTARTYTVQAGDTLHKISTKVYGNTAMWEKIYDLNRDVIGSKPSNLRVGMTLRLPADAPSR